MDRVAGIDLGTESTPTSILAFFGRPLGLAAVSPLVRAAVPRIMRFPKSAWAGQAFARRRIGAMPHGDRPDVLSDLIGRNS